MDNLSHTPDEADAKMEALELLICSNCREDSIFHLQDSHGEESWYCEHRQNLVIAVPGKDIVRTNNLSREEYFLVMAETMMQWQRMYIEHTAAPN